MCVCVCGVCGVCACACVCGESEVHMWCVFVWIHALLVKVWNASVYQWLLLSPLSGVEAVLVCQALASIAAHTPGTWSHVTPTLLDYLNTKTDQHHRIIVRTLYQLRASNFDIYMHVL